MIGRREILYLTGMVVDAIPDLSVCFFREKDCVYREKYVILIFIRITKKLYDFSTLNPIFGQKKYCFPKCLLRLFAFIPSVNLPFMFNRTFVASNRLRKMK